MITKEARIQRKRVHFQTHVWTHVQVKVSSSSYDILLIRHVCHTLNIMVPFFGNFFAECLCNSVCKSPPTHTPFELYVTAN